MSRRLTYLCAAALVPAAMALAAGSASAEQPDIVWKAGLAVANGTGCSSLAGDTVFIAAGNDVAVLFSRLGVDLPVGGGNFTLSDLKNCAVRIPAIIRSGLMISQLKQVITYGVNKSGNTSGKITSLASFFNQSIAAFVVNVPFGIQNEPAVAREQITPFVVASSCAQSATGLYRSDMAVSGNRSSAGESIILTTQGLDLRYDVLVTLIHC